MQVCRNGHVITDLLHSFPERGRGYCEQCGADTLDRCPTCGRHLTGAVLVPGLVPMAASAPPSYCSHCGAAFPWTAPCPDHEPSDALVRLETLLRRLPRVIRELRSRHGDRPPFVVVDERDLEDLLRALLPLHFENVRLSRRTPRYAATTCTDFLLAEEGIILTVKQANSETGERKLAEQISLDAAHYGGQPSPALVSFVYDPEGRLRQPELLERAWSRLADAPPLRCVIAS